MRRHDRNGRRYALGLMIVLLAAPLAGCIGDTGEQLDAASSDEDASLEETTIPFDGEGSFPLGVGVCTVAGEVSVNACSASNVLLERQPAGTVQAVDLEVTWDAGTPLMEELGVTFAWACEDQAGCETEWATGSSPLGLSVEGVEAPGSVYVLVWTPSHGISEAYVDYSTPQDVAVSGTFTSLVPSGAGSGA